MKTRELFLKDPLTWQIANEGVSSNNVEDLDTLRYELDTFVCQGEYQSGLAKILKGYLDNLGHEQKAAWVSGFYGSGKSHLVKVLRYFWTDYALPGGVTARTLATLPEDITDLLKELSTRGKQGCRPAQCRRYHEGRRGQRALAPPWHCFSIGRSARKHLPGSSPDGPAR